MCMVLFRDKKKVLRVEDEPTVEDVDVRIGSRQAAKTTPVVSKELPPIPEPVPVTDPDAQSLYEAVLGMSELTFKVEVLSLLLEINQRLINVEKKANE